MNAALVQSYDAPPVYTTFEAPIAAEGEQLVTVAAAGLHQIVKSVASGQHYTSTGKLPFIPGVDATGRLVGPLGSLPAGTRIYFGGARFPYGTMCEQTVIGNMMVIPLPDSLDDAFAAAVANPAMSSWVALDRGRFTPGESVLILGATGTSGQLAVQIAKARGAGHIIAAGRNPEALEKLKSLGADRTISLTQDRDAIIADYRSAIADCGIDVVLDYLWGPAAEATLAAISQRGVIKSGTRVRFVQIGNLAGENISLSAHTLRSTNLELLGSGFGSADLTAIRTAITEFFTLTTTHPFDFSYKTAPLSEVTALWNEKDQATRLVFQP
ncbi:zinc-binding dehydrogenase [Granulicella sp. 5B5]|uniref:quinone oxidoreductase family protein n=1 Tax=Granulicella sp. 5B5 TaxID=1617967 RepID=UPI0015F5471C|nr:zinc-binding alcohol dehydrogenase family protein [Granulicella sp. 5B5]QMV18977.1 zinc-binding dehydrogenase [Granulicella sp. 5B5]